MNALAHAQCHEVSKQTTINWLLLKKFIGTTTELFSFIMFANFQECLYGIDIFPTAEPSYLFVFTKNKASDIVAYIYILYYESFTAQLF